MTKQLLDIRGLSTYFYLSRGTIRVVDGVDLEIGEDEAVALVGESGSGKSTTALSIMRLVPRPGKIVSGQMLYKDVDLSNLAENKMAKIRGKEIAMVFQDPQTFLNPVLSVGKQISETIRTHAKVTSKDANKAAVKLLESVGIPDAENIVKRYPHELSGGMKQRCLIAIALACNPALLIADEPTTALDVTVQAQILDLIKSLREKQKMSLLLITHDLGIVADMCDRVYVMYAGRIVETADVYELFEHPKHPYTMGLLNSTMSVVDFKEKIETIEGVVPNPNNLPGGCSFHPRCPFAMEVCIREEPPVIEVAGNHKVACWLYP